MKSFYLLNRICRVSINNVNVYCHKKPTLFHVRHSATVISSNYSNLTPLVINIRHLGLGPTSKDFEEPSQFTGPVTKAHATELILRLNDDERKLLFTALQEYESTRIKDEFEGSIFKVLFKI